MSNESQPMIQEEYKTPEWFMLYLKSHNIFDKLQAMNIQQLNQELGGDVTTLKFQDIMYVLNDGSDVAEVAELLRKKEEAGIKPDSMTYTVDSQSNVIPGDFNNPDTINEQTRRDLQPEQPSNE